MSNITPIIFAFVAIGWVIFFYFGFKIIKPLVKREIKQEQNYSLKAFLIDFLFFAISLFSFIQFVNLLNISNNIISIFGPLCILLICAAVSYQSPFIYKMYRYGVLLLILYGIIVIVILSISNFSSMINSLKQIYEIYNFFMTGIFVFQIGDFTRRVINIAKGWK